MSLCSTRIGVLSTAIGYKFEGITGCIQRLSLVLAPESSHHATYCLHSRSRSPEDTVFEYFTRTERPEGRTTNIPRKGLDTDENFDVLQWWKQNSSHIPKWSAAPKRIFLIQPSWATVPGATLMISMFSSTTLDMSPHMISLCKGKFFNYRDRGRA